MIYNEVFVVPWFGLKESVENHRKAMEPQVKDEELKEELLES